jgi:hypothetical protein
VSVWTTIEAEFQGLSSDDLGDWPTGSESGPTPFEYHGESVSLSGRLRDFGDHQCPQALGWFVAVCDLYWPKSASLILDVDDGPKYRWKWDERGLQKMKGILDA